MELIEANYLTDGNDWTVTVTGRGKTLAGKAPGVIAARDCAEQLVEQLASREEGRTVVHLLDGDAVEFMTAYLTARLTKAVVPPEAAEPQSAATPGSDAVDASESAHPTAGTKPDREVDQNAVEDAVEPLEAAEREAAEQVEVDVEIGD